jgi:hypothetical protein
MGTGFNGRRVHVAFTFKYLGVHFRIVHIVIKSRISLLFIQAIIDSLGAVDAALVIVKMPGFVTHYFLVVICSIMLTRARTPPLIRVDMVDCQNAVVEIVGFGEDDWH